MLGVVAWWSALYRVRILVWPSGDDGSAVQMREHCVGEFFAGASLLLLLLCFAMTATMMECNVMDSHVENERTNEGTNETRQ